MSIHAEPHQFEAGEYTVEVLAKVVAHERPVSLGVTKIDLSVEQSDQLRERRGILFERDPIVGAFKGAPQPDPTDKRAVALDKARIEARLAGWANDQANLD